MNFAHFCEFWCFSLGKRARFTLNFCSGMPLRKVHELTFLWFGLPAPLLTHSLCSCCVWTRPGRHWGGQIHAQGFLGYTSASTEAVIQLGKSRSLHLLKSHSGTLALKAENPEGIHKNHPNRQKTLENKEKSVLVNPLLRRFTRVIDFLH